MYPHVLQNGLLTHSQDLDGPLRVAAQRKINAYGQQYDDNQNISFLPSIMSTSFRMHGEFFRLIFSQAGPVEIYLSTYVSIYMFLVLAMPEVPVLSLPFVCVCHPTTVAAAPYHPHTRPPDVHAPLCV